MKILRIYNKKGEFITRDSEWLSVKEITKESILDLLNVIYDAKESVIFDEINVDNPIVNPAEKLIYENLLSQFYEYMTNLDEIKSEIENNFQKEINELFD